VERETISLSRYAIKHPVSPGLRGFGVTAFPHGAAKVHYGPLGGAPGRSASSKRSSQSSISLSVFSFFTRKVQLLTLCLAGPLLNSF